jgi:hypothetical protein
MFTDFDSPLVTNEHGAAVFRGTLSGVGVTAANSTALYASLPGAPAHLFVRAGDVAPGANGGRFIEFGNWGIDNAGVVVFTARVDGGSPYAQWGLWSGHASSGPATLLLRSGDSYPLAGLPNAVVYSMQFADLGVNPAGTVVLSGGVDQQLGFGLTVDAIWAGPTTGPLSPVASGRRDLPGQAAGVWLTDYGTPWVNAAGDVVFTATHSPWPGYEALYFYHAGLISTIASENAVSQLRGFNSPGLADNGTIFATARFGSPPDSVSSIKPWVRSPDGTVTMPWDGNPAPVAPECPAGVRYGGVLGNPRVSSRGDTLVCCTLSDGTQAHLVIAPDGTRRKVARTTEPMPGQPAGAVFTSLGYNSVDASGRVVLTANGGGQFVVTYIWDAARGLRLPMASGTRALFPDGLSRPLLAAGAILYGAHDTQSLPLASDGYIVMFSAVRETPASSVQSVVVRVRLDGLCSAADVGRRGGVAGMDDTLDNNDFIVFINWFFAADLRADLGSSGGEWGADGMLDNNDFIAFIGAFFAGCQ